MFSRVYLILRLFYVRLTFKCQTVVIVFVCLPVVFVYFKPDLVVYTGLCMHSTRTCACVCTSQKFSELRANRFRILNELQHFNPTGERLNSWATVKIFFLSNMAWCCGMYLTLLVVIGGYCVHVAEREWYINKSYHFDTGSFICTYYFE
jgi:hypothetical protein